MAGSGRGVKGWMVLEEARVYHDHPFKAQLEHAVMIDLVNEELDLTKRVALELSPDTAEAFAHALLEVAREAKQHV